ncbi:hypothetical protein Tco_0540496 [Tanacetum coccineum]
MDVGISLVPPQQIFREDNDETEVLLEKEATEIVQDQGSGEKGEQEVSIADTALNTANVPISTASETPQVSTAAGSLVYIRRSEKKKKDKGKAILIEDESVQKKSKKQEQEERLGHEEAIRLQEQIDEDERKRIARDAKIAKQLQEEYDKCGKKEVVTKVDWKRISKKRTKIQVKTDKTEHGMEKREKSRLQVLQKKDGIFISQDKYVADILKKFDFATVKTASTPMEPNKALVKDKEADSVDVICSKLLLKFQSSCCEEDLIYLKEVDIIGNVKKHTIVVNSTTEAEYVATASCCGQNLVFHSKTKHIEIRHHFIKDCYEKKLIQVIKIHTDHNVADLLTKAFDVSRFNFLIASIGLLNL